MLFIKFITFHLDLKPQWAYIVYMAIHHRGELSRRFLSEHKKADELVYDTKTKLPIGAIYLNPEYTYIEETKILLMKLRRMIENEPS